MTPTDSDQMVDVVNDITADWESLIRTYVPRIGSIPMCQGITWSPSWKAVPSRGRKSDRALRDRDCRGKKESLSESVDHTLVGDRDTPYEIKKYTSVERVKSGDNGKREEWDLQTRPTKIKN